MNQSNKPQLECNLCGSALEMGEGVVLYDTKWFHQNCWEEFKKRCSING